MCVAVTATKRYEWALRHFFYLSNQLLFQITVKADLKKKKGAKNFNITEQVYNILSFLYHIILVFFFFGE